MISGETKQLNDGAMENSDATKTGAQRHTLRDKALLLFATIPIVAAIAGYLTLPSHKPLLDEQFLFSWIGKAPRLEGSSSLSGFFSWPGFENSDHWGPLTHAALLAGGALFAKNVVLFRLFSLGLHCASVALVFAICRGLRLNHGMAAAAAILFALYPLSSQAVAWGGGFGSELGGFFLLASLALYCKLRQSGLNWVLLGCSLVSFALAMAASTNFWFAPLLVLWLELASLPFRKDESNSRDFTQIAIPTLLFGMISAVFVAACGTEAINTPDFRLANIVYLFRDLFLPINQMSFHKYSREYVSAYVMIGFLVPALGIALWRVAAARRVLLVACGWLAIAALPFCGTIMTTTGFYGSQWLYFAAMPIALIGGIACSGISAAFKNHKLPLHIAIAVVLTLLTSGFYLRHLWNSNQSSRNQARILSSVQKSMGIANAKLNRPFLILRDLPARMSVAPAFAPIGPACFDTATGQLRSAPVPEGKLKDLLKQGKLTDISLRWENNLHSFLPLDLTPEKATWPAELKPVDIGYRLSPALPFYKTISMDPTGQNMILETNSENGPMITLTSCELSPLDGDYVCVEAQIDCAPTVVLPSIELHWQTKVHQDFERKERFSYSRVVVNDKQYHRYFLSLRRNGWTTGGSPQVIALGFPAGSKVWLKTITLERGTRDSASLQPETPSAVVQTSARFTPPYYNFPTDLELGLVALPDNTDAIKASFSVENLPTATGALVEVSKSNQPFDDANSNHLSSVTLRTYSLKSRTGSINVPVADLSGAGVYSIRVIGTDENGAYCGMFSDALSYQVPAGRSN